MRDPNERPIFIDLASLLRALADVVKQHDDSGPSVAWLSSYLVGNATPRKLVDQIVKLARAVRRR